MKENWYKESERCISGINKMELSLNDEEKEKGLVRRRRQKAGVIQLSSVWMAYASIKCGSIRHYVYGNRAESKD